MTIKRNTLSVNQWQFFQSQLLIMAGNLAIFLNNLLPTLETVEPANWKLSPTPSQGLHAILESASSKSTSHRAEFQLRIQLCKSSDFSFKFSLGTVAASMRYSLCDTCSVPFLPFHSYKRLKGGVTLPFHITVFYT